MENNSNPVQWFYLQHSRQAHAFKSYEAKRPICRKNSGEKKADPVIEKMKCKSCLKLLDPSEHDADLFCSWFYKETAHYMHKVDALLLIKSLAPEFLEKLRRGE
jgi:hypothetical protein